MIGICELCKRKIQKAENLGRAKGESGKGVTLMDDTKDREQIQRVMDKLILMQRYRPKLVQLRAPAEQQWYLGRMIQAVCHEAS